MPINYLRAPNGCHRGASDTSFQLPNNDCAWVDMPKVCGDPVGDVLCSFEQSPSGEWNASMEPLFRIRIVAETLD